MLRTSINNQAYILRQALSGYFSIPRFHPLTTVQHIPLSDCPALPDYIDYQDFALLQNSITSPYTASSTALRAGKHTSPQSFDIVSALVRQGESVSHIYRLIGRYLPIITNLFSVELTRSGLFLCVNVHQRGLPLSATRPLLESLLAFQYQIWRRVAPEQHVIYQTECPWPASDAASVQLYQHYLGHNLLFQQPQARVLLRESSYAPSGYPCQDIVLEALTRAANKRLFLCLNGQNIVARAHSAIAGTLGHRQVSLGAVAHQLQRTEKTLQRQLARADTSFKQLLHTIRLQRLEELLQGPPIPVKALAAELGFQEPRSLNRWIRKHRGISPSQLWQDRNPLLRLVKN